MMFKGAMFAKPTPPSSRPTTATTSILTDQSEYPELTLLEWAEWAATAMWWERLYAGHRPRELGRLSVPPADVNGGAFRLHEAVNNETAGDRDAEAERYVDGTTTDWPSVTTQVPAPHVPAPPPPTPEQTFRRQLARRAASTGRAKLGVGRKGGLARQVGLNSPRTGSLCAPGDVPRVPFVRAQVAHVEQGTAVAGAAWDRAGRKQITAEITKHLHGEGPMQKEPRYFSNPTPSVASGRGDTPSGAAANWVLPKHDVDRAALLYEDRASLTHCQPFWTERPASSEAAPASATFAWPSQHTCRESPHPYSWTRVCSDDLPRPHSAQADLPMHADSSDTGRWNQFQPLSWGVRPSTVDCEIVKPHAGDYERVRASMVTEARHGLVTWSDKFDKASARWAPPVASTMSYASTRSVMSAVSASSSAGASPRPARWPGTGGPSTASTFRKERAMASAKVEEQSPSPSWASVPEGWEAVQSPHAELPSAAVGA